MVFIVQRTHYYLLEEMPEHENIFSGESVTNVGATISYGTIYYASSINMLSIINHDYGVRF